MTALDYYPDLVTLDYMRRQRDLNTSETADDTYLTDLIHGVSAFMGQTIERIAMPYLATKTCDYCEGTIWDARTLYTDDDLLSITTLTSAGDAVSSSNYVLRPANQLPAYLVCLKLAANAWSYTTDTLDAISIVGEWGYVPHYGREWVDSGIDVPAGDLAQGAVTVTVSDSSGFEVLQYLKIDNEVLQITANNTSANTLTLTRGELGTTDAAHTEGADITTYVQAPDIVLDASKMVGYLYKSRQDIGGEIRIYGGAGVEVERLDPAIARYLRDKHARKRPFIA